MQNPSSAQRHSFFRDLFLVDAVKPPSTQRAVGQYSRLSRELSPKSWSDLTVFVWSSSLTCSGRASEGRDAQAACADTC